MLISGLEVRRRLRAIDLAPSVTIIKRRPFLVLFLLYWGISAAWSISTPLFASPDETGHVFRAASVAHGYFAAADGDDLELGVLLAPSSLAEAAQQVGCFAFHPEVTANCAVEPEPDGDLVPTVAQSMARYNPLYYGLVGLPSLVSADWSVVYFMRLISGALCAAAFAIGSVYLLRIVRAPVAGLAIVVALTPMTFFLSGMVNVNSLEIASAFAVWCTAAFVLRNASVVRVRDVAALTLAASALVVTRSLSPLWLVVILAALMAATDSVDWRSLLSRRSVIFAAIWVGILSSACAVWTVRSRALELYGTGIPGTGFEQGIKYAFFSTPYWLHQVIGYFGWLDTPAPLLTVLAWILILGMLTFVGVVAIRPRMAVVVGFIVGLVLIAPIILEARGYAEVGPVWQGRYILPIAVGVPVLIALGVERLPFRDARRRIVWSVACLAGAGQTAAFYWTMRRYVVGDTSNASFDISDGAWEPPWPPAVLIVVFATSVVLSNLFVMFKEESHVDHNQWPVATQLRDRALDRDAVPERG